MKKIIFIIAILTLFLTSCSVDWTTPLLKGDDDHSYSTDTIFDLTEYDIFELSPDITYHNLSVKGVKIGDPYTVLEPVFGVHDIATSYEDGSILNLEYSFDETNISGIIVSIEEGKIRTISVIIPFWKFLEGRFSEPETITKEEIYFSEQFGVPEGFMDVMKHRIFQYQKGIDIVMRAGDVHTISIIKRDELLNKYDVTKNPLNFSVKPPAQEDEFERDEDGAIILTPEDLARTQQEGKQFVVAPEE